MALQILLNDTYKLNHCKEMGAKLGWRFLKQPAEKLKAVFVDRLIRYTVLRLTGQQLSNSQTCTGSGFQDSSPAGFSTAHFEQTGWDPVYGFTLVSGSGSGFSNFIFGDLTPTQ